MATRFSDGWGGDRSGPTATKPDNAPLGALWMDETLKQVFMQTGDGMELLGAIPRSTLYVDSATGSDSNNGSSWDDPLLTITAAVAAAEADGTILIRGSFNEAVTSSLSGLRILGVGTGPKRAQWTAPTVAGSWCLKLAADYQQVGNIYFRPVTYTTSGIPSGIHLAGANWASIYGCRFHGKTGSYKAIYSPAADSDNVHIQDNEFYYLNTATHGAGIWLVEAGGLSYSGWQIRRNVFSSCVTAISMAARACVLEGNHILINGVTAAGALDAVCTLGINLRGANNAASNGANAVHGNYLGGTYSESLYKDAANDDWAGNFNIAGITGANPAP